MWESRATIEFFPKAGRLGGWLITVPVAGRRGSGAGPFKTFWCSQVPDFAFEPPRSRNRSNTAIAPRVSALVAH